MSIIKNITSLLYYTTYVSCKPHTATKNVTVTIQPFSSFGSIKLWCRAIYGTMGQAHLCRKYARRFALLAVTRRACPPCYSQYAQKKYFIKMALFNERGYENSKLFASQLRA